MREDVMWLVTLVQGLLKGEHVMWYGYGNFCIVPTRGALFVTQPHPRVYLDRKKQKDRQIDDGPTADHWAMDRWTGRYPHRNMQSLGCLLHTRRGACTGSYLRSYRPTCLPACQPSNLHRRLHMYYIHTRTSFVGPGNPKSLHTCCLKPFSS